MAEKNKRQRRRARRMEQPKRDQRGRKGKEDSGNFIDSVESAIGEAALKTNPGYLATKPAVDFARLVEENPESARRVARKMGGAAQRGLETASKFTPSALAARGFDAASKVTPPALAARLLEKLLEDGEQEEEVSRSRKDRRARNKKREARKAAMQSSGQDGLEGALSGAADQEESLIIDDSKFEREKPLIIDDSKFEDPEDEEPEKIDFVEDYEPSGVPLIGVEDIDVSEPTLRAEPVPEMDEKESGRLFKMIMGSSFDPVSSMDKGKMGSLEEGKG